MIRVKLCIMMFLEIFIWGAWFIKIFDYLEKLGFNSTEQAWILGAFNIAALTAMFFSTQFVDRNFAAEKFLAFSHVIGGLALIGLAYVDIVWGNLTDAVGLDVGPFWPFFLLMLVYSLF